MGGNTGFLGAGCWGLLLFGATREGELGCGAGHKVPLLLSRRAPHRYRHPWRRVHRGGVPAQMLGIATPGHRSEGPWQNDQEADGER
eukprot:gene7564-biopygen3063